MDNNSILIQLPGVQIMRPSACVLMIKYDDQLVVTLELARQITEQVAQQFGSTELGVVHSAGKLTTLEPGVREYIESNNRYQHKIAEAFVVKNLSQRILANFYIRIKKHGCPTEVFSNEDEACRWVKMYCRSNDAENKIGGAKQFSSTPAILAN